MTSPLPGSPADLAACIDHTLLKQETRPEDVHRLCEEAVSFGFRAVCIHPSYVPAAVSRLAQKGRLAGKLADIDL